jgi:hypothetical protein
MARGFEDQADAIYRRSKMNEREQVIEAIAKLFNGSGWSPEDQESLANHILSLSGPGWRIAVVREKGELPRVEQPTRNYTDVNFGYQLAQQDMLDAGFVQEIREETKG